MKKWIDKYGYIRLRGVAIKTYALEHRYVMEQHLGRKLKHTELIHHINGDTSDNRIENLRIMSFYEHSLMHKRERMKNILNGRWSENYDCCVECGKKDKKMAKKGVCFRCYDREWAREIRRKNGQIPLEVMRQFWGVTKSGEFFTCCRDCGTIERKHFCHGRCVKCQNKTR